MRVAPARFLSITLYYRMIGDVKICHLRCLTADGDLDLPFQPVCRHRDGGRCNYSHVPDMFNYCKYAHSQEELDEWRERYEWREMKRTLAKEQNMFSYMDDLLEQYNSADSQSTVVS